MKTTLFIALLLLTSIFVQARKIITPDDLRQGDTITLKVTVADGMVGHNSVWDFDQVQKLEIRLNVISTDKDSIRMGVVPTNWYGHFQNKDQYEPHSRFKVYGYFDSYFFHTTWDGKSGFYLFKDNNVIVAIDRNDRKASTTFLPNPEEEKGNGERRDEFFNSMAQMPSGVKITPVPMPPPNFTLNFKEVLKTSVEGFFSEWATKSKDGKPMPWYVDLRSTIKPVAAQDPTFVQVISASFGPDPNIHLTYKVPANTLPGKIFIADGNEKIEPERKGDGVYQFSFFLPSPKRMTINNVILDLTPGDSINIEYIPATNEYAFYGRGSSNSAYTNTIAKFYEEEKGLRNYKHVSELSENQINDFFAKGKERHQVLLAQYAESMNEYWLRSAQLSSYYWYVSEKIYINNEMTRQNIGMMRPIPQQYQVDWISEQVAALSPITDYLYQPYTYNYFLDNYCDHKAWQTNDDVLTGMRYLKEHIPRYYFADAIFWGYPRFYLTGATLKYLMRGFHLSESDREYRDFLSKCLEPDLRKDIIFMHDQIAKVEPGANIKGLNLAIESHIPLKHTHSDYIALLVNDSPDRDSERKLLRVYQVLKDAKFDDRIRLCFIIPESKKEYFKPASEIYKYILFVSEDKLYDYYSKVITRKNCYIIMRDDGTIISRENGNYDDSGAYLIYDVQKDIDNQANHDTASSGIVVIILSSLASIILTFFIVRTVIQRRERRKRQISELELKAIRAQMNPHFTFNALGSIQNLINQKKDKEANDYLVNFAKLLRMVLSTSEKRLITLSEEVEQLELYLRLEQLRVPFKYTIRIDTNIDTGNEEIPGMLIQPIVENAVKHAIVPKGGGQIEIYFGMNNNVLHVIVSDSGDGYFESKDNKGFGLQAVRERLKLLNKEMKLEIGMKIENRETDGKITGCIVIISIPV